MSVCDCMSQWAPLLDKQTIQDVPHLHPTGVGVGFSFPITPEGIKQAWKLDEPKKKSEILWTTLASESDPSQLFTSTQDNTPVRGLKRKRQEDKEEEKKMESKKKRSCLKGKYADTDSMVSSIHTTRGRKVARVNSNLMINMWLWSAAQAFKRGKQIQQSQHTTDYQSIVLVSGHLKSQWLKMSHLCALWMRSQR